MSEEERQALTVLRNASVTAVPFATWDKLLAVVGTPSNTIDGQRARLELLVGLNASDIRLILELLPQQPPSVAGALAGLEAELAIVYAGRSNRLFSTILADLRSAGGTLASNVAPQDRYIIAKLKALSWMYHDTGDDVARSRYREQIVAILNSPAMPYKQSKDMVQLSGQNVPGFLGAYSKGYARHQLQGSSAVPASVFAGEVAASYDRWNRVVKFSGTGDRSAVEDWQVGLLGLSIANGKHDKSKLNPANRTHQAALELASDIEQARTMESGTKPAVEARSNIIEQNIQDDDFIRAMGAGTPLTGTMQQQMTFQQRAREIERRLKMRGVSFPAPKISNKQQLTVYAQQAVKKLEAGKKQATRASAMPAKVLGSPARGLGFLHALEEQGIEYDSDYDDERAGYLRGVNVMDVQRYLDSKRTQRSRAGRP